MKIYAILLTISSLCFLASCDKAETPPSYLHFDKISVEGNINAPSNQGSLRHKIPNGYVTIRDEASNSPASDMGYQNIPATFPYLGSGLSTITISPAVPVNASSTSIIEYPFFERIVLENYDLKALMVDTISLVTRYKDVTQIDILFNEDFESNASLFSSYAQDNMEGLLVNEIGNADAVYEGTQSGHIHLDENNRLIDVATGAFFQLDSKQPFLEFDYKTDVAITIGLIATNGSSLEVQELGGVFAKEGWNKAYFQLKDLVSDFETRGFTNFQINLFAGLPTNMTSADIYLDNFKLLKLK